MVLDLDIGNSRIKWRVTDHAGASFSAGVVSGCQDLMSVVVSKFPLERVRIACVRDGPLLQEVVTELENTLHLEVELARVSRQCQGVTVAYEDLNRLGVDRWLAMLAAYRDAGSAVVVVDCGTALTVDLVDASGSHLGGYIVPGLRLVPLSLTQNTAIRLKSEPDWDLGPGNSTEDAIYHGALLMLVALVESVVTRELPRLRGKMPAVMYLTGGDAGLFEQHIRLSGIPVRLSRELVLEGLQLALP